MATFLISRVAADDLHDYWTSVAFDDGDDADYVQDNADCIEAVREACLALGRAIHEQKFKALLAVEVSEAAAREVANEAENRLDIHKGALEDYLAVTLDEQRQARALISAFKRLLKMLKSLGIEAPVSGSR